MFRCLPWFIGSFIGVFVLGKRRVGAIMHGGGQGATLSCGMRMGWALAKTELDQAVVAGWGMVSEF
jgi:hypothetical protein